MKVRLIPADSAGCGYYRVRLPSEAAAKLGYDVAVADNKELINPDVLVMQRPMHRMFIEKVIPMAKAAGIATVVEVDDDFENLSQTNPAFWNTHPKANPDLHRGFLKKACAMVDMVTVTTPALGRVYGQGKSVVLPNCVPEWYTDIEHEDTGRAGWTGSLVWHTEDLMMVQGKIADSTPFTNIGDTQSEPYLPGLDIHTVPFKPLDEYPYEIAKLSVGIVPLVDNAFNRGKSALKATEYAACGVFPLMSALPDQVRLHEQYGIGEIIDKPKYWNRAVQWWVPRDEGRRERTRGARAVVREALTYEARAGDWVAAWAKADEIAMPR